MSESAAYSNYTNTSQRLSQGVNQDAATSSQVVDDRKDFEAQFLVGVGVASKVKLTDMIGKAIKSSKTIKNVSSAVESAKNDFGAGVKNVANKVANKLQSKVPKLTKALKGDDSNLSQLKDLQTAAESKANDTKGALESAQNEVVDSRDALRTASAARDAAEVESATQDANLVAKAGGAISRTEQAAATAARVALNQTRDDVDSAAARSSSAEENVTKLAQQSAQHDADASRAAEDVSNAAKAEKSVGEGAEAAAKTEEVAAKAEEVEGRLAKVAKVAKKVEEGGETDEFDPIQAVATAVAATVATIIGRKIKQHSQLVTGGSNIVSSFTSTIGA